MYTHSEHHFPLSESHRQYAATAVNHEQLYLATGSINTMQVLPCGSIAKPGTFLNGTRLQLSKGAEEGYDFFICSASTRARTIQFHEELEAAFHRLESALLKWYQIHESHTQNEHKKVKEGVDVNHGISAAKDGTWEICSTQYLSITILYFLYN